MSGTTEQPLNEVPIVASHTGLFVLAFDSTGKPSGIEPAAFLAAPAEGAALSDATPLAGATAGTPGTATTAARADHRHPLPTAVQVGAAPTAHSHAISDVTNLQASLDAKAPNSHTHSISGVNGLQAALDAKAPVAHSHIIGDVTGLQPALDAKQTASAKGVANGYAPLDNAGRVPLANLPDTAAGVTNVSNGTLAGQVPVWDTATSRFQPRMPAPITEDIDPTVERNSPTVLSFADYNRRIITLTGNAPLTLAASEIGVAPKQGMSFVITNEYTAVNTITFGAGITVDAFPVGTGTAGAVRIQANGGLVAVLIHPVGGQLKARVRGQIV